MPRLLLALAVFTLTACSPADKDEPAWKSSNRATRLLDEHRIDCQGGCPAGVGLLVKSSISGAGRCTTWIAGEYEGKTVVVTNKHCVQDMVDCASEVAVSFARTRETAQCLRALQISEFSLGAAESEPNRVPDYAVLQLDRRLSETPLPISQLGLAPMTANVTLRKAWIQGDRWVEMREEVCATGAAGMMAPDYTSADSPNISTYGCHLKGGVSGSPVLNPSGQVAAMIQIGPGDQASSSQKYDPRFDMSAMDRLVHGAATNLACVNSPEIGLVRAPTCALSSDYVGTRASDYAARVMKQRLLESALLEKLAAFSDGEKSGLFEWDVRPDDGEGDLGWGQPKELAIEMVPKCVRPGTKAGLNSVAISSPRFTAKIVADRYGTLSVELTERKKYASYTLERGYGSSTTVVENALGRERRMRLPLCGSVPST